MEIGRKLLINSELYKSQINNYIESFKFWFDNVKVKISGNWKDSNGNDIFCEPYENVFLNFNNSNQFTIKVKKEDKIIYPIKNKAFIILSGDFKQID